MSVALTSEKIREIQDIKEDQFITHRSTIRALEDILYDPLPVLDHGFIRVIDYMGDDSAIVQAARVSYGRGTKMVNEDRGLINYLMRHRHTTPFEMCEIKLHIKLPIFVARQWIRHRTANVNEYSARYSILDKEFYVPAPENLAVQSQSNRQGREEAALEGKQAEQVFAWLKEDALRAYNHYERMLNIDTEGSTLDPDFPGLARELARTNLPVNFYTQMYWKIDLHNFMHFLSLRADAHAQYEIRAYANILLDILKKWVPMTYDAFVDYRQGSASLSAKGLNVVKALLKGQPMDQASSGMSPREWRELHQLLELPLPHKG